MISITATKDGLVNCEHIEVLTNSQFEKLECEQLSERIDNVCKDLGITSRYIKSNESMNMSVIGMIRKEYDDQAKHDLEMAHVNFLKAIDNMELPEPEDNNDNTDVEFDDPISVCKGILKEMEERPHGIVIVRKIFGDFAEPCGEMSHNMLKRMLECYIKCNEHQE